MSKLEDKVDRSEITLQILPELSKKLDRSEFEQVETVTDGIRVEMDQRMTDFNLEIDTYIGQFKADLDDIGTKLTAAVDKKVDIKEMDTIYGLLSKKVDTETVNELLHI
jgi:hypothetical protein